MVFQFPLIWRRVQDYLDVEYDPVFLRNGCSVSSIHVQTYAVLCLTAQFQWLFSLSQLSTFLASQSSVCVVKTREEASLPKA